MMLQDIAPHVYDNAYRPRPAVANDHLLIFKDHALLCAKNEDGTVSLPHCGDRQGQYLFSIDGAGYYLWEGDVPEAELPFDYISTRTLRDATPDHTLFACAAAESLDRWYRQNRFCGACGGEMGRGTEERSLVCKKCGQTLYPKICPAVIVAVTDGDRLVLTKYAGRAFKRYALIAGFNEIGESIEDTVRREVMEEVGLRVKNLRFYKSQPWVYTDTLLFGFYAELDGDDTIHRQESELAEAGWFNRDSLPTDHSATSLTGEMIEVFRIGQEKTFGSSSLV